MIYQEFKRKLLNEMRLRRDMIVVGTKTTSLEPIFEISNSDDKTYNKILYELDRIALRHSKRLLADLCKDYGIDVKIDNKVTIGDLQITVNYKPILIELVTSPRTDRLKSKVIEARNLTLPIYFVYLLKDTQKSRDILAKKENALNEICKPIDIRFVLFDDLLAELFGYKELNRFRMAMSTYKEEMHQVIGYQITEMFNEHNLSLLKKELEEELRLFDYDSIRQERFMSLRADNNRFRDINDSNFAIIKTKFVEQERYQLLLKERDFAKSFLTSEWLYKKYVTLPEMDNTFIVAGYLKSIEQLLWRIICIVGQGRAVQGVIVAENNENDIDTTLGSLQWFITDYANDDLFENAFETCTHFVMNYLRAQLKDWKNKYRNGYFHKHNLKDESKIKKIRSETIYLHFLILGTIFLNENTIIRLSS